MPQIVDGTTFLPLETTKKEKLRSFRIRQSELPVWLWIELFDTFQLYQWFNLNFAPFLHTFNARMNNAFPSRKMRDCELAQTFCFWKPYSTRVRCRKYFPLKLFRTFTGKMTRGLSLRMIFSLLFVDTLFSGQALRSPDTGAHGGLGGQCKTQLAAERPLCTHVPIIIIIFGLELGPYQHSHAAQRSILEHVSICSPSQFVHLHGKPY